MRRVELFTKGLGPRISDMGKPMRDGDGDGKCQERGGKWVPCPPNVSGGSFLWDEVSDLIDYQALTKVDDPEDAELTFEEMVRDDWLRWKECRGIRQKAYEIAGASDSSSDPHVRRTAANLFGDPTIEGPESSDEMLRAQAVYLMGQMASKAKNKNENYRPLYRAIKLEDGERESFFASMVPGETIAIPLMASSNQREVAGHDVLSRYGNDALIVVRGPSVSHGLHNIGVYAGDEFEIMMMDDLEGQLDDIEAQIEDAREAGDMELVDQLQYNADSLANSIRSYDDARKNGTQAELKAALDDIRENHLPESGYPLPGDEIDPESSNHPQAQQLWNDAFDFEEETEQPAEYVTGGTFKVISVEDDPRDVYGKVIILEQSGVFDPGNPGSILPVGRS